MFREEARSIELNTNKTKYIPQFVTNSRPEWPMKEKHEIKMLIVRSGLNLYEMPATIGCICAQLFQNLELFPIVGYILNWMIVSLTNYAIKNH